VRKQHRTLLAPVPEIIVAGEKGTLQIKDMPDVTIPFQ
jgi:hypothetical protein